MPRGCGAFFFGGGAVVRFVDNDALAEEFIRLCKGTAFGCKLEGVILSYGFSRPFARFWTDGSAAYGQLDGTLSLAGAPAHWEEAAAFIAMLGPEAVFGPAHVLEKLDLPPALAGPVLAKSTPPSGSAPQPEVDLRGVHRLLAEVNMAGPWEPFYLDLSHRLRHGTACAAVKYAGGGLAGCAVAGAVTQEAALLSALAVGEGFRRQGVGTQLVADLWALAPGRTLYALRGEGENEAFYQELGFRNVGAWAQWER